MKINDYEKRYHHLMKLLRKSIKLVQQVYSRVKDNPKYYDKYEEYKAWHELQTLMNIEYLAYNIEHTTDFEKIDVVSSFLDEEV